MLIKSKNERFAERKSAKRRAKLFVEPVPYSEELKVYGGFREMPDE